MKKILYIIPIILISISIYFFSQSSKDNNLEEPNKSASKNKNKLVHSKSALFEDQQKNVDLKEITPKKEKLYQKLLKVTHYKEGSLKKMMEASLEQSGKRDAKVLEILKQFDFEKKIKKAMLENLDEKTIEDLIAFNQEPIVEEINKENQALLNNPEKSQELKEFIGEFDSNEISEQRNNLLNSIMENSGAMERTKNTLDQTLKAAILSQYSDLSFEEQNQKYQEARDNFEQHMQSKWSSLKQNIKAASYYPLQNLSDEKLREYSNVLLKSNLTEYNEASAKASSKVMVEFFKLLPKPKPKN